MKHAAVALALLVAACGRTDFDSAKCVLADCGGELPGDDDVIGDGDDDPVAVAELAFDVRALSHTATVQFTEVAANAYDVFWSTDPGCSIEKIPTCSGSGSLLGVHTPVEVAGLTNGVGYYFLLRETAADGATKSVKAEAHPARIGFDDSVRAITPRPAGGAYVGGAFARAGATLGTAIPVAGSRGSVRAAFPVVDGTVHAIASDGRGGWYVGGDNLSVNDTSIGGVAHVLPDGTFDAAFPRAIGVVYAIAVDTNGTTYFGGTLTDMGGNARNGLAAVNPEGTVNEFAVAASFVLTLALNDTGLFVGGLFTSLAELPRSYLGAVTRDGTVLPWAPEPNGSVSAIALDGDTVYVGGAFTSVGTAARNYVAAIDASGTATSWNPNANAVVEAIAVAPSAIYLGGNFTAIGGTAHAWLAAVDRAGSIGAWDPKLDARVYALAFGDSVLYCGGELRIAGTERRDHAAAFSADGSLSPWDPSSSTSVTAIAHSTNAAGALPGSTLYLGGGGTLWGTVPRGNVAAIDAEGALTPFDGGANGLVQALAVGNGVLYAGGTFTQAGGASRNNVAALDATSAQATSWRGDTTGPVNALLHTSNGVFVGGQFGLLAGATRTNLGLVRDDGILDAWNPAPNGAVNALAAVTRLNVGGAFTTISGVSRNRFAAYDPNGLTLSTYEANPNNTITAFAVDTTQTDRYYAGGDFTQIFANANQRVAQLGTTGQAGNWDYPVTGGRVLAMAVNATGTLYIGGTFTSVSGGARVRVAAMPPTNAGLLPFNPRVDNTVYAIAPIADRVFIGGQFLHTRGTPSPSFAIVDSDGVLLP